MTRIGILAGGGRLPLMIAESVVQRGGAVHIVGIEGEADAAIARFPHTWVKWGQIGRMVATLRSQGGSDLVIAGGVRRPDLRKIRPDMGFFKSLPQLIGLLAGGDDSVLSRVVRFFEANGFTVHGAHEVAPDLLLGAGALGAAGLSLSGRSDATIGFAVRAALGPLDAGQAVVVAGGRVLAIEGAEGTDAMLERVWRLREGENFAAGGILAKGPKPGQELRVDMPAVGPRTVELGIAAGLAGVAVEAGGVLMLDREQAVRMADAQGFAIEGLSRAGGDERAGGPRAAEPRSGRVAGRLQPGARERSDIVRGLAAVERLAAFDTGHAVVLISAYFVALAAAESAISMLERVRALRQWGIGGRRRRGVLVCRAVGALTEAGGLATLLARAAAQGLAGLAVAGTPDQRAAFDEDGGRLADAAGLFLVTFDAPEPDRGR